MALDFRAGVPYLEESCSVQPTEALTEPAQLVYQTLTSNNEAGSAAPGGSVRKRRSSRTSWAAHTELNDVAASLVTETQQLIFSLDRQRPFDSSGDSSAGRFYTTKNTLTSFLAAVRERENQPEASEPG